MPLIRSELAILYIKSAKDLTSAYLLRQRECQRQWPSNHFRTFHIRLDYRRSWRQNQNDSPYLFAIVYRSLTAIADCSAARQQMDQNEDMKRLLQQLLLLPLSACCRSADGCLPQIYIDS